MEDDCSSDHSLQPQGLSDQAHQEFASHTVQHVPRTAAILSRDHDWNGKDTYLTHFNGGRPFKVIIQPSTVLVYDNYGSDDKLPLVFTDIRKLFVGKSPLTAMTEFSGDYGKNFDGNSILLQTESLKYVFIGDTIYSFDAVANIVSYVSEVGNNDVPYPYAVDDQNNVYLMIEKVMVNNDINSSDPYNDLLYSREDSKSIIMTATGGVVALIGVDYTDDRQHIEQVFNISWQIDAKRHYNMPWMADLKAVYSDGTTMYLSEDDYIVMMDEIKEALGLSNMNVTILSLPD